MRIYVGMGTNLGQRNENMQAAFAFLRSLDTNARFSPVYETAPLDCPTGSGDFLNAVAEIQWEQSLETLLDTFQTFELERGRAAIRPLNSPRPIDLDILLADDLQLTTPRLTIPHPRMFERLFVLEPLADLAPGLKPPQSAQTISQLLPQLRERAKDQICRKFA